MSMVAFLPKCSEVSTTARQSFKRLVLASEKQGTHHWSIAGTQQARLAGLGSFHHEGNYLLRSSVKQWMGGLLCAVALHPKDNYTGIWYCDTEDGRAYSTNRRALERVFADATVAYATEPPLAI